MARRFRIRRKQDGPWNFRWPAIEFAVDEIGKPSEQEADRRHTRQDICKRQQRCPVAPRMEHRGDSHAETAAVEGHASLPQGERFQRMVHEP